MIERKTKTPELLFEDFISDRITRGICQKSLLDYRAAWGHFLAHSSGELTKENWAKYLLYLSQSDMSVASKNHYIGTNRAVFYYLMQEGFIPAFKIRLMRGQEQQCKAYTQEETKALLRLDFRHCNYVEYRSYAIICFVLATGSRCNTILNVKVNDIMGDYLTVREQKNKKASIIPLSIQCQKILRDFRNAWDTNSEWLFPDYNGNQLTWSGLRLSLEKYFKARNVKYHGVHSLRHTFAKLFIINGGNAFQLQKMLGHSSIEMTRRYVALYSSECKEAIQSATPLDNILKK